MNPLFTIPKSLVLIGMPGSGKSTIGRCLAAHLALPFIDSDNEIEAVTGMTITQIFETLGEPTFREKEREVIARLLAGHPRVISTGGGAFMNEATHALIKERGISICLKANLDILVDRTTVSHGRPLAERPLLKTGDPRMILQNLMNLRDPVFAQADITVPTDDRPAETTTSNVLQALKAYVKEGS